MSESSQQVCDALAAASTAANLHITTLDASCVTLTSDLAAREAEVAAQSVLLEEASTALDQAAADLAAKDAELAAQAPLIASQAAEITAKTATIAEQTATIAGQVATINQRDATIAAQTTTIAARNATITAQAATIAAQAARIEALESELNGEEEPLDLAMQIGCNQGSIPGCAASTQMVRIYAGAQFAPVTAALGTGSNWGDHVLKRSIAITFNDEPLTGLKTRVKAFLDSVPKAQMTGKLRLYVTNVHELERGDKGNDPAAAQAWTKETILAIREWRAANKLPDGKELNVWCNPNYMGWYERDAATANTSTRDWWPKDVGLHDVVLGIDPYDPTASREIGYLVDPTVALWKLDGGTRFMLCETNTKRTGTDARDWWNRTFAKMDADGCEGLLLFLHASAGKDAPWTIDAMSAQAFNAAIVARPL
jgi:hypothetical protein